MTKEVVTRDSLRAAQDGAPPPRVTPPKRTAGAAEQAGTVADLGALRTEALEVFTTAAEQIARALRIYGAAWKLATRASHAAAHDAANRPAVGGVLQPETSPLHPRHVKRALVRTLTSAGIDLADFDTRVAGRKRGRR